MTVTLTEYARSKGQHVRGLKRDPGTGRRLGQAFETRTQCHLDGHRAQQLRLGHPAPLANWTQPKFRWCGQRGWQPCGAGWVDLALYTASGVINVDLKSVDMASKKHKKRWTLDKKLRRDLGGHQIATLDGLVALGQRAGVLLGQYHAHRASPWTLYAVPTSVDFHRPSIPWEELEAFKVSEGALWWLCFEISNSRGEKDED